MGSVMDQERPWERNERIQGYWLKDIAKLKAEVLELEKLPWEHVAYREAKEVYEKRLIRGN